MRVWKSAIYAIAALALGANALLAGEAAKPRPKQKAETPQVNLPHAFESLRLAIDDLIATFGPQYARGSEFLHRLESLERRVGQGEEGIAKELAALREDALLANPLLDFDKLILLERKRGQLGLPTNHQCNPSLAQTGYENRIAVLSPVRRTGQRTTLYRPDGGQYVGEIDLHFDADRLLFTMPNGRSWQIHEIGVAGSGLRQVSREEADVDNFDACYLPDGRIVFASTASFTGVPCWHGRERACCIYSMNADGSGVRQLCFDQDLDLHPSVLANGQIVYSRWDYTGIMHVYLRPLMAMNPDGTLQRAVYGSNSYYPNSLFFPRAVPGSPTKLAAILAGYHGPNRMGELVVLDTSKGWYEERGIVHRIAHRSEPIVPERRDNLIGDSWPKFLHPYPLSEKYLLAASQLNAKSPWGIYLVDVFDNMVPLAIDPKFDFFEPIPLRRTPKPPAIPDRVDLRRDDATVYLHNVYAGPGLRGVPPGSVKRLRIAAYHYGYPGMADPDKIGRGGPWEAMRILGTVPVYEDGSASFRIPASTPITLQPLDDDGKALALMRSWYTAMPGEQASCVGCHEHPSEAPATRLEIAATKPPVEIEPWHGPARGFDFEREVQPVLDKHCVGCHNGQPGKDGRQLCDLRSERFATNYRGLPLSKLGATRLDPALRQCSEKFPPHQPEHPLLGDRNTLYTPAYEVLARYIRRVNIEDYVGLHVPGEYYADTSELVQMLQKGHHNVKLDREAWDRLFTWIDLNGPCHGTWNDVAPIPNGAGRRRRELALKFGGPKEDPEQVPELPRWSGSPIVPEPLPDRKPPNVEIPGWPFDPSEAQRRQRSRGEWEKTIDLGGGVSLRMVRIPAGEFPMGSCDGEVDEAPVARVRIPRDFWMSACEITNEQFQRYAPDHFSGYFMKRSMGNDGPGIAMDRPKQPAVRLSWHQAADYCRWLSQRTGLRFNLPTEAHWEYAARAGTASDLNFGSVAADFTKHANVADAFLVQLHNVTGGVVVLQDFPADTRFNDGGIATADVGQYQPNAWGLFDMHGNAAEWTRSTYRPYPFVDSAADQTAKPEDRKVVRGGSFHDRPARCRSSFRLNYAAWQRVHDVGFRVVCEEPQRLASDR